jgi:DNA ligase-1
VANELNDGDSVEVQGSGTARYTLKNVGGVYSCSCPAWRNQSTGIERRTCKHLKAYRGESAELERVGAPPAVTIAAKASSSSGAAVKKDTAPPVLLAHTWENDIDLAGWWMSEKLDGVRAYWDGSTFVSRLGNRYFAPDWFTQGLPPIPLDGELWVGRKQFQSTVSIVRRQDQSAEWKKVSYVVFDAPARNEPFEARMAFVEAEMARIASPYARAHTHEQCRDVAHLREELARVEALGGEGLMLRKPGSHYAVGRSSTLLKVKSFHDAEARVVEHSPGTGKHKGRLGALVVEMPDGTRFNVGTGFTDAERMSPPEIGALITYRYQELSDAGVPRFPSYVGVRHDVAWPAKPKKPAGPPKPPRAAKTAPSTGARHFEMAQKFWEISVDDAGITIRFGRQGAAGHTQRKELGSRAAAEAEAGRLITEKTAKGYVER